MASATHVVWLDECSAEHAPDVGRKAVGLGALVREALKEAMKGGAPVNVVVSPDGQVLTEGS